jgi:3-oxoacyl-[acyl-carrier protein] reductase
MDLRLKNKNAIVTGASKGIGRVIAARLAEEGVNVAICARAQAPLRDAESALCAFGVTVFAQTCDVADAQALDLFLDNARAALGRIDILVNNVSALAFDDDETGWRGNFDVDVMTAVRATQKVVPWMADNGGSIINIASNSGLEAGSPAAYAAAKAALISYSKTSAIALAPRGIRVNVVAPGSTEFPGGIWDGIKHSNPALYETVRATMPSGRMGTPEEIADVVTFVASPRANWMVGACVVVDGGQHKANL